MAPYLQQQAVIALSKFFSWRKRLANVRSLAGVLELKLGGKLILLHQTLHLQLR